MIHKSFDIPWERINEIVATSNKTVFYLNTIAEFSNWVDNNLANLDVEQVNSIYEDFVQSNEHIIEKINKIRSNSNSFNNFHPPCLSSSSTTNRDQK